MGLPNCPINCQRIHRSLCHKLLAGPMVPIRNSLRSVSSFVLSFSFFVGFGTGAPGTPGITPIPMELLNPRLTEFKRIDSSGDDQITFSEFLLSDRPWMETMSRRFHTIDANSDGRVTRREYDAFFRGRDEEQERQRNQADNFFKQLTVTVGPIVEREQEGDAQNGSSRMRYFRAGSRKYAAITHGTGLFPPPSSAPSPSVDLPPSLFRDHDHHFHNIFQSHPQFMLPSSASMLGPHQPDGGSPEQQSTSSGGPAQAVQQRERALKNEGGPTQI